MYHTVGQPKAPEQSASTQPLTEAHSQTATASVADMVSKPISAIDIHMRIYGSPAGVSLTLSSTLPHLPHQRLTEDG
jgi:hypothetical protein